MAEQVDNFEILLTEIEDQITTYEFLSTKKSGYLEGYADALRSIRTKLKAKLFLIQVNSMKKQEGN